MNRLIIALAVLFIAANGFSQSSDWLLTGNAGTGPLSDFVGTTNSQPLVFKVNGGLAGFTGYPERYNVAWGVAAYRNLYGPGYNNTVMGVEALNLYHSVAIGNVAIGRWVLNSNYDGNDNVALGVSAMSTNWWGHYNTVLGWQALFANVGGPSNTAVGQYAAFATTVSCNTAVGFQSLKSNGSGADNTAIGFNALVSSSGSANTAFGSEALVENSGNYNTAMGFKSLRDNSGGGEYNISIGAQTMMYSTAGSNNVALGSEALLSNTSGNGNTALGASALQYAHTSENTAIGGEALTGNVEGEMNTAIGTRALWSRDNQTGEVYGNGNSNTAIGYEALREIRARGGVEAGSNNIAVNVHALAHDTTGHYNIAVGTQSLYHNIDGSGNFAFGNQALRDNTGAIDNMAMGRALYQNLGTDNIATGADALFQNTNGSSNIAFGAGALYSNTDGSNNVAFSCESLYSNTEGGNNIALGYRALYTNTTGSYNTALGYMADVSAGNFTNSTAIGYGAIVTASNMVRIGNDSVTSIGGQMPWTSASDGRIKKNIRPNVPGLTFINQLQPVTYNLDREASRKIVRGETKNSDSTPAPPVVNDAAGSDVLYSGFVAQEVEKTAQSMGYDFSGVDADENGKGLYGLRYAEFVVPLVKAVQELEERNKAKDAAIAQLQEQITALSELINRWEEE
ncbi:MAG: tail fiber domain-containing protein [Dysgonamonadaceae bacterium]|jgi:hypothetical protein|nr:tail fiber domain-containing protein [Dysgonamonadaceae bacterium]